VTRRLDRTRVETRSGERPGHHRVRVPHLTRAQLVSTPDEWRHGPQGAEQLGDVLGPVTDAHRARDGFREVRNDTVRPAPHLVPKRPEPAQHSCADGSFAYGTVVGTRHVPDRSHLHCVRRVTLTDEQSGVEQRPRPALLVPRAEALIDSSVPAHEVASGTHRQPVEVDAGGGHRWMPSAWSRKVVTRIVHSRGAAASPWVCDAPLTVQTWTRSRAALCR